MSPVKIGSVGDSCDNALMESIIDLYKTEIIKRLGPWKTLTDVEIATAEWIDWFNNRRIFSVLGHIPPAEYEANYYQHHQNMQVAATACSLERTRSGSELALRADDRTGPDASRHKDVARHRDLFCTLFSGATSYA